MARAGIPALLAPFPRLPADLAAHVAALGHRVADEMAAAEIEVVLHVCTTRLVAGVGVPQLTAVSDCSGLDVPIIADGGIRTSGDIAKALAAGASSVMIGSMFAGTKESPGEIEQHPQGLVKRVRGMASFEALERRALREGTEVDAEYFEQRAPEGVEGIVAYKGSVGPLVNKLIAGVRSSMSYVNATSIAEFQANAQFIRITNAGLTESHPHATVR